MDGSNQVIMLDGSNQVIMLTGKKNRKNKLSWIDQCRGLNCTYKFIAILFLPIIVKSDDVWST
jgi:hypothetical protein